MAVGNLDVATVRCPICGIKLTLVLGDNPMGTKTVNEHFAKTKCHVENPA